MGIRKYRGQIVCDKRWPDGSRIIRKCSNRTQAKGLLARMKELPCPQKPGGCDVEAVLKRLQGWIRDHP